MKFFQIGRNEYDGSLTSRLKSNALITDHAAAIRQVVRMVKENKVTATDGSVVSILANTICIHGDGAHALAFARQIPDALRKEGIEVKGFGNAQL